MVYEFFMIFFLNMFSMDLRYIYCWFLYCIKRNIYAPLPYDNYSFSYGIWQNFCYNLETDVSMVKFENFQITIQENLLNFWIFVYFYYFRRGLTQHKCLISWKSFKVGDCSDNHCAVCFTQSEASGEIEGTWVVKAYIHYCLIIYMYVVKRFYGLESFGASKYAYMGSWIYIMWILNINYSRLYGCKWAKSFLTAKVDMLTVFFRNETNQKFSTKLEKNIFRRYYINSARRCEVKEITF